MIATDSASKLPASRPVPAGVVRRLAHGFARIDLRLVFGAMLGLAAVAAALGIHHLATARTDPGSSTDFFDLDGEETFITVLTSVALLDAALAALIAGELFADGRRWVFRFLAAFFAFMALDEGLSFHEGIERTTGVDWQILYTPLFLLAAAAGIWTLGALRSNRPALLAFAAGGGAWVLAQLLEELQWGHDDKPIGLYNALMVPEELLEFLGSSLFFVAFVLVVRRAVAEAGGLATRAAD